MSASVRLRHLAQINPPTPEFDKLPADTEVTFLPLEAVWSGAQLDTTRLCAKSEVATGYTRFREGDVLIPKITPTFEADRSVIAVGLKDGVGAGTTELHIIRTGTETDRRYIKYLASSRSFLLGGEAEMFGVAGQKRVPDSWLRDFPVPVTAKARQAAIADFLDTEVARIDALVAKKKRMARLLATRLEVLIESRTVTEAAGRPTRLKHVTSIERGRFNHRPRNEPALYGEVFPFVQTGDIRSAGHYVTTATQYLSGAGKRISRSFPAGTTLMGIAANVGDIAVTTFETWCPDSVVGFIPGPLIDPDYLYFLLRGLRRQINETSSENTQENTNIERLGCLRFPLPLMSAQRAIAVSLEKAELRVFALASALNRQIELLRERRQALITAAVTGEMDVPGVSA